MPAYRAPEIGVTCTDPAFILCSIVHDNRGMFGIRAGSVLRLFLPPKNRTKQPFTSGPNVVCQPCRHCRTAMRHLTLLLDFQAAVRAAEVIASAREPTHPAVIPWCFRKGQRLPKCLDITNT
jgi:hypothetical protein